MFGACTASETLLRGKSVDNCRTLVASNVPEIKPSSVDLPMPAQARFAGLAFPTIARAER